MAAAAPSAPVPTWARLAQPLPWFAALALFLVWANAAGGYFPHAWYAGGLFLGAIVLVLLVAWPGLLGGLRRTTLVALAALAAFTAWSYLSILWADVRGDAWDGASRSALYLLVFALFSLWRAPAWAAHAVFAAFAVGVAALGFGTLLGAAASDDAGPYFILDRFIDPIGYVNGNAALFVLAFWPALFLASRREVHPAIRGLMLAAAGVLVQLAVLPQSRGAAFAFPIVFLLYVALVPGRLRALVAAAPVAVVLAVGFPRLVGVADDASGAGLAAGCRDAAVAIGLGAVVLGGVGYGIAWLDRRREFSERTRRRAAVAVAAGAAVTAVVALAAGFAVADLGGRVERGWDELRAPPAPLTGSNRFTGGLRSNRSDLWRVALDEWQAHPLHGIGADNFTVPYVRERRSDTETLYPHSFPLQLLTQTGLVGASLFACFLVAAVAAAAASRRAPDQAVAGVAAVGLVVFASWFAHASIDWLWELPALAAPALASLAIAGSVSRELPRTASGPVRAAGWVATGLVALLCLSFVPPWLAARETRAAAAEWRRDPGGADARLRRARRLNPLSEHADLTTGSIALRRRDWTAMAAAYEAALERNPHSWYAHLQLALAELQRGRRRAAAAELRAADTLNPTEPVIDLVGDAVARGERVDPDEVARILLERHEQVTGGEPTRKPSRRMSMGVWPNGDTSITVWRGRRCSTSSAHSMGPCGEGELS